MSHDEKPSRQPAMAEPQPTADRPDMPADYGLLAPTAGSGLIPWQRADEQLAAARNYWVSTSRPDGRPHAMPVWGVWLNGTFYFGTGPTSRKARNLAANPAIAVHLESGDDVVILEGTAVKISDRAQLDPADAAYRAKYDVPLAEDPDSALVYGVRPRVAFAWRERDFPGGATRWQFDNE